MLPKRIGLLGFERVAACQLAGLADVFAAAVLNDGFGNRIPCYHVDTIGLSSGFFRSESDMLFKASETLQTAANLDTIVVPGGNGLQQPDVIDKIADWILIHANRTRRIAAIETGIYCLAPTGLLDGRQVSIDRRYAVDVAQRFPKLIVNHTTALVRDGPFYTASGPSAAFDLAASFVEEDYGSQIAHATARQGIPPMNGNGHKELTKPAIFDSQPTDRFAELVAWIMRNLQADLSVNNLARRACMSPSHFNRAFKTVFGSTPADFVETLRVNEAKRRLSTPKRTLDTIAASVGFSDRDAFRRAFERRFGATPRRYLEDVNSNSATANGKTQKVSLRDDCFAENIS